MKIKTSVLLFSIISTSFAFSIEINPIKPVSVTKPSIPSVANIQKPQIPQIDTQIKNQTPNISIDNPSSKIKENSKEVPHLGEMADFPKEKGDIYTLNNGKAIKIFWADTYDNETGWEIYKDGKLIDTLPINSTKFVDRDIVDGESYVYEIAPLFTEGKGDVIKTEVSIIDKSNEIQNYISQIQQKLIGSKPSKEEIQNYSKKLQNGVSIAKIIEEMIKKKEFQPTYQNDKEYIQKLYQALFDEEIESFILEDLIDKLNSTEISKPEILYYFVNSKKFQDYTNSKGIEGADPDNIKEQIQLEKLSDFVKRMYTKALSRDAEKGGFNYWVIELLSKRKTPKQIANFFFNSKEFKDKHLSDKEFLDRIYLTIMGRKPDKSGYDYWLQRLANHSTDRQKIIDSFINSKEFKNLEKEYGLSS